MRRHSLSVVLAVVGVVAAGCSQSDKGPTADGKQEGVQGKYYFVNLDTPPLGGVITSDLGGIDCGAASRTVNNNVSPAQYSYGFYPSGSALSDKCGQTRFDWAQTVVLTASPRNGSSFIGWAGSCSGNGTCTLSAGADKSVVAIFGPAGGGHFNFANPVDHGPAYQAYLDGTLGALNCQSCHGAQLQGKGIAPACALCHEINGIADWTTQCDFCHGKLKGDATKYHHVLSSVPTNWASYPTNAQPAIASGNPLFSADKNCLQCHVEHDLFAPDHGTNLRDSILSSNPTATAADGGLCTSCHGLTQTKDRAGQKDDGTLATYAIDPAAFWAGGHGYLVNGSIRGAGGDFQVACTKCHNSDTTFSYQDGAFGFALHTSADRRLRAPLGRSGAADDQAEAFCYRCHSNAGDAVGGAAKAASGSDWYGAATMPVGATGVFTQFNGVPALPTTTTDTLYFKPSAEELPTAPVPAGPGAEPASAATSTLYLTNAAFPQSFGNQLASGTYNTNALVQNAMSLTGVAATATTVPITTVSGATAYDRIAQWISPPFASGFTWASGNVVLYIYRQESATSANCFFRYAAYKLSGGVLTAVVAPTSGTSEFSTTAGIQNFNMALLTNSTFAAGDQLVVELEVYKNAPSAAGTCSVTYGNTAVDQSRIVMPATAAGAYPEVAGAVTQSTTWVARSMSPYLPNTANETITGTDASAAFATQLWERASFVSVPVTAAAAIPAGTWTLSVNANRGSFSSSTAYLRYRLYQLNASGSAGTEITPWTTRASALGSSTGAITISAAGAAVSLQPGDKVVVDLEVESMNTTAVGTANANLVFGSGNPSSVKAPAAMTFAAITPAVVPAYGHFGAPYTGVHRPNPAEENLTYLSSAKHVECSDCHDAHGAKRGNQADGGTATAASATTLTDANQTWRTNAWVGYSVDVVSGTGAGGRAMITGNDATTLTFQTLATAPVAGSTYRVSVRSNAGAVTAWTANSLTDGQALIGGTAVKTWATNAFNGWTVRIVLGTGVGQSRVVTANDSTSLTVAPDWTTQPDATSRYVVDAMPGVLAGAGGVNVTAWDAGSPTAWGETKTLSPAPGSTTAIPDATTQWQVCFKCHSAANSNVTAWKSGWTDLASEFNPRNQSYHPIVAPSVAFAATGYGNTQVAAANLSGGWKPGDMMYCSDCHGNTETGYTASQGPHASAVPFMLRGTAVRWPTMANGTTRWTTSNYTTGAGTKDGLFCLNCHATLASVHTRSDHSGTACTACHILIPHGGKLKRLMATAATASVTYNNRGLWSATTAYAVNDYVNVSGTTRYYRCTIAGTSGTTAPTSTSGSNTITDGTVGWRYSSSAPVNIVGNGGTPAPYRDTGVTQLLNAYGGGASSGSTSCNACGEHSMVVSTTNAW